MLENSDCLSSPPCFLNGEWSGVPAGVPAAERLLETWCSPDVSRRNEGKMRSARAALEGGAAARQASQGYLQPDVGGANIPTAEGELSDLAGDEPLFKALYQWCARAFPPPPLQRGLRAASACALRSAHGSPLSGRRQAGGARRAAYR